MPTRKQVRTAFQSVVLSAYSGVYPISLDNKKFDPPQTGPYLRVSVSFGDGGEDTLGVDRKSTRIGRVFVQVFTPAGTGTDLSDSISDNLVSLINNKHLLTGLWTGIASSREVGVTDKWYQCNVSAGFTYEYSS